MHLHSLSPWLRLDQLDVCGGEAGATWREKDDFHVQVATKQLLSCFLEVKQSHVKTVKAAKAGRAVNLNNIMTH